MARVEGEHNNSEAESSMFKPLTPEEIERAVKALESLDPPIEEVIERLRKTREVTSKAMNFHFDI